MAARYHHSTVFTVLGPVPMVAAPANFGRGTTAGDEEALPLPLPLLLSVPAAELFLTLLGLARAFGL